MISSMLAAAAVAQVPQSPLVRLEAFLIKHPVYSVDFSLNESGRVPAQGVLIRQGDKAWRFTLKGTELHASLTRIGDALVEIDHLEKRYEEFDEFTSGRHGSGLFPYFPTAVSLDQVKRWSAIKPQSTSGNTITVVERTVTTTLTVNADGSPQTLVSKTQVHQESTVLTFKFANYSFEKIPPLHLLPPAGYSPWVEEVRWPLPVGDQMPDVLGRGEKLVPWKSICEGQRSLLVLVQEGDKLSDALRADIMKRQDKLSSSKVRLVFCFVGKPANYDKEPLWIVPDGRACRALGLVGTPVMSLVGVDRMVEWTWQGYGVKQRERAMTSLMEALTVKR